MIISESPYYFSQLTKFKIFDADLNYLGRIGDALLDKDTLQLDSFILYGSFFEELMEDLGIIDDVDPLISISDITKIDKNKKEFVINKIKAVVSTTNNNWVKPKNVYQFSKLGKLKFIFDKQELQIGKIIDIIFLSDNTYTLVISLKKKFAKDKELLIHKKYVTNLSETRISFDINKNELMSDLKTKNNETGKLLAEESFGFIPAPSKIKHIFGRKRIQQSLLQIEPKRLHRYYLLELSYDRVTELPQFKKHLESISSIMKRVKVRNLNLENPTDPLSFTKLFNLVLMTSPDPYRPLTEKETIKYFKEGTFLAFLSGIQEPIGYGVVTIENTPEGKIGVIAGIGIHPRHRRKKIALAIAVAIGEWFLKRKDLIKLQCEVYEKNEISLLFIRSLGFKIVGEMFLP